ncbi:hypothetical protein LTR37_010765 [Vermiconidia calcicola]|uniref:Uncharacterized protein n=1 Tax=Vermiconidia calcicola TaxID=1690605 RepID=A0ACC3N4E8_9PEZI|nr:hypothetical protein LTR37_010765 [Vermiconidia calcicola]
MSTGQSRGRGRGRGRGDGQPSKGGDRGGGGGGRGDRGGGSDRGSGRGDRGGGGDRGGFRGRGGGGPPARGQDVQMASRGPPTPRAVGGIFIGAAPAPDPSITAAENALVAATRGQTIDGFPGRRGYGTKGKPIVLRTNYFKLNTTFDSADKLEDKTLHRYEVNVTPDLSKQKKRRLLDMLIEHSKFEDTTRATDYAKIIVTTDRIDLGPNNEWKESFTVPPEDSTGGQVAEEGEVPEFVIQARNRNRVEVTIRLSNSFSLHPIMEYLRHNSAGAMYQGQVNLIQLLNIIMCKAPQEKTTVANVGQNKFYPLNGHPAHENFELGGGLEAIRGYFSSVRPVINRLLVNINVTSGAFYKSMPLSNLLNETGFRNNEQIEGFIRMLKVRAVYKKDGAAQAHMTKVKTIVGFARQPRFGNAKAVKFSFTDMSGPMPKQQELSVFDYFKRERQITLQKPDQPVLNVGTKGDPQYLPIELCYVIPGQPYRRILAGEHTAEMIKFAVRPPNVNAMSIAGTAHAPGNGVRLFRLAGSPGEDVQAQSVKPFGFSVNTEMITVPGRILSGHRVNYGDKTETPRNGTWNCADRKFSVPGRHGKWQILVINRQGQRTLFDEPRDGLPPAQLFNELERSLGTYGLRMGQRVSTQSIMLDQLTVPNRNSNNRKIHGAYQKAEEQDVRLLFIVLPEADKWLYARIKYYGDIEFGIHSINAVGSKLQKSKNQGMFLGNLALKFNIKGGGVSHKIQNVLTKPLDNNTMLVGIDVTHPSPGSTQGAPSIACIVASTDEFLFQWPGSVRTQTGREEMVQGLEAMVLERLDLWRSKHNKLPTKIVIYRDGVSEGQYELVLSNELPAFVKAFDKQYGKVAQHPKVAIIIVGKRHHTRFYPTKVEDADYNAQRDKGSWNPLPGTIVDRGIAGRVLREFWLQAHQGLQGTARPAHYVVIKDDIAFEADELEQFTHNMCYLFNRATKAVSICPPAYYADLLCERGRAYLYSTLAENHASDSSQFDGDNAEWTGGVHERLKSSTWYI